MGGYYNPNPGVRDTGGASGTPGSNQFMTGLPSLPANNTPRVGGLNNNGPFSMPQHYNPVNTPPQQSAPWNPFEVPQQGGNYAGATNGPGAPRAPAYSQDIGHGIVATGLQYPGLSQDLANFLMSQIGQGVSPFGLQTSLPTGGMTQPGQLTAGMNPLLAQLAQFFQTGKGGGAPGLNTLSTIANQGISALPEWQSMIDAQQQNIQQNQANLKEQFASMGDLAGSPFGTAMSNYMQQTSKDQNALLGQLQQTNILQGQIPVAEGLMQGGASMAGGLQDLNQQAINNMLQEFIRTSPQNNPLLQMQLAMGTLYPPTTKTPTKWDMINQTIGALTGSGFSSSSGGASGASSTQITF